MKRVLDRLVRRYNTKAFIDTDPVKFPRRCKKLQDIEITAFLVASVTWGNRKAILSSCEKMLEKLGQSPYDFVMEGAYEKLGAGNIHRTFFEGDMAHMLRGFRLIYEQNRSMNAFLKRKRVKTPWDVARALQAEMTRANDGRVNPKCMPVNFEKTALKRINLALRWLVRQDGIVDLGVWDCLSPADLFIPLDVHAGNTARRLSLLQRKQNDRQAVQELTAVLRGFCPEDPVKYDFALFGAGIAERL
ncbi:MAG: TIGR02757 family protein [Fusobacteriaceae bacterium]|jgi:uncharacterized protein (TIGR02757 family)|nr:TIGR02757 family protein [Fusobacteriaceae bacterium]